MYFLKLAQSSISNNCGFIFVVLVRMLLMKIVMLLFLVRYDYENCESAPAEQMIHNLEKFIVDPSVLGKTFSYENKAFKIAKTDNFEYTDPIDQSISKKQVSDNVSYVLSFLISHLVSQTGLT